jgi:hypothetical protein
MAGIVLWAAKKFNHKGHEGTRRFTFKPQFLREPLCPLWLRSVRLCRFAVSALSGFAQRDKTRGVIRRDISQDLAVQFHAGLLQAADELVIANALSARGGSNADDPDGPVLALLPLILWRRDEVSILLENTRWRAQVSFCGAGGAWYHVLREACVAPFFVAGFPAVIAAAGKVLFPCSLALSINPAIALSFFRSSLSADLHQAGQTLSLIRDHPLDFWRVSRTHQSIGIKVALALGVFGGKDMTLERFTALDLAGGGLLKAFGCAFVGF